MVLPMARRVGADEARAVADRVAAVLARDPRVRLVYLFGSASAEQLLVRDVDVAILTTAPLSADALSALRADCASGQGVEGDLVSLNDASIVLAHEVADTGRCLFART
jgi:hypothetical protein